MCKQRGSGFCSELGSDPDKWSRNEPLPKPADFDQLWSRFQDVIMHERRREFQQARAILEAFPGESLRQWFDVHAQNSGEWRSKEFNIQAPNRILPLDPVKQFNKYFSEILKRDNFRCRYCGRTVIPSIWLKEIHLHIGSQFFPIGRKNSDRNGYFLNLCATLDHVLPHSLGGQTNPNNLVTSCWPCNYGKMNWTLEQIGLEDPFLREPLPLESPIEYLKGIPL